MRCFLLMLILSSNYNLVAQSFFSKSTGYSTQILQLSKTGQIYSVKNNEGYISNVAQILGTWEAYDSTIVMEIEGDNKVYDKRIVNGISLLIDKKYSDLEFESFEKEIEDRISNSEDYKYFSKLDSVNNRNILDQIIEEMVSITFFNHNVFLELKKDDLSTILLNKFFDKN